MAILPRTASHAPAKPAPMQSSPVVQAGKFEKYSGRGIPSPPVQARAGAGAGAGAELGPGRIAKHTENQLEAELF